MTEERFWSKIDKSPGQGPNGDCWIWKGSGNTKVNKSTGEKEKSYGTVGHKKKHKLAHRLAWEYENGREPIGYICHTCDYPPCCKPAHLVERDATWNNRDMFAKGRHRGGRKKAMSPFHISEMFRRLSLGETARSIAKDFGVSEATMSSVRNKKNPFYVGILDAESLDNTDTTE